jgi:hypothetical protein
MADPDLLRSELAAAARGCVALDHVDVVVIGGAPSPWRPNTCTPPSACR